ncbi:MAG: RES domain-containing protein [Rhodococcus sp. (in: high G+C Gram-positive bacteria)]|uniref:RES family NAD+ phosphorylase n=1 Tax=Nocardiaceae TaxID=85025 RepID=UPI000522F25A|nr:MULTISPECIES: RES domain-containing protein [Rhodococcus]OZD18137.1 hypothetical protein CH280_06075 [Rhodococcus sp. 06-156-4C]OZD18734.1 hypothetical protein CH253_16750 [Rhodococcus sp. 06-156-3C]OZD22243.1 hypothetical protein CH248_08335 [Rhodococcus sp. 06-156-4a]OZD34050.1 hypothetical protein CH247_08160 [Rhodococcus sp. 06-156-3b]OZD38787.1 hypothetical protein CH284_06580 [Rhodococcus sp. 06-156-3]
MSLELDDVVVERIDALGTSVFDGKAYRYTTVRRDPLSGAGARLYGGRWNPRGVFPAIYLAIPEAACMGEVQRAAAANQLDPHEMLQVPYLLHTLEVRDLAVLDLRTPEALGFVGLDPADIADDDWTACQAVGHAAWFLKVPAVIAPSATGQGHVLTLFETRLPPGAVHVTESRSLTPSLYDELSDISA